MNINKIISDIINKRLPVKIITKDKARAVDKKISKNFYNPRQHPTFELFYILKGKCLIKMAEKWIEAEQYNTGIIPPDLKHAEYFYKKNLNYSILWIRFLGNKINIHINHYKSPGYFRSKDSLELNISEDMSDILLEITIENKYQNKHNSLLLKSLVNQIFITIARALGEASLQPETNVSAKPYNIYKMFVIGKIQVYIRSHLHQKISLQDISRFVNLTPNYISTLFKKTTGISITDYITTLKIKKTKNLLLNTKLSLDKIANNTGYNHIYYLSRVFKTKEGCSPFKFREKFRTKKEKV
jgi:YesN/AraC family two-component response regulator